MHGISDSLHWQSNPMATIRFLLNQTSMAEVAPPATPLLDVIRRGQHLTGCKEACREGDCGACLVLVGNIEQSRLIYRPATACLLPLGAVEGRHIVTIEGLSGSSLNPIQQALVDQGGIQCGFCTPGLVIALTAFFLNGTVSDVDAAIDAVAGNLCRCTGYSAIKRAVHQLCERFDLAGSSPENRTNDCLHWQLLPVYFAGIAEQLAILPGDRIRGGDEAEVLIGGGTDLMVRQAESLTGRNLNFLPTASDRECVRLDGRQCRIAASTTIEQLRTSPLMQELLPMVGEDLKLLCSAPLRQHATVAGNIAHASPIADLAVIFLALDAKLSLVKLGRQRSLRLKDFFIGYKQTACQAGEQILEINFDVPGPTGGFSFEKVSKRVFLDIASVNSALAIRLADGLIASVHLAAGGVAPIPLYLTATCDYLRGKVVKAEIVVAATAIAQNEISPIADLRGSVEYKRLLFRQLIFAHFLKLFPEQINWEALHALS